MQVHRLLVANTPQQATKVSLPGIPIPSGVLEVLLLGAIAKHIPQYFRAVVTFTLEIPTCTSTLSPGTSHTVQSRHGCMHEN